VTADIYRETLTQTATKLFEYFPLLKYEMSSEGIFLVTSSSRDLVCRGEGWVRRISFDGMRIQWY
jgi:hypothetical protein